MMSKSRSVSRAVSEVVGSSKMMICASAPSALAISTSWRSPWLSRATGVSRRQSRSTVASSSRAPLADLPAVDQAAATRPARGKPAMKMFSSIVRFVKRLSS